MSIDLKNPGAIPPLEVASYCCSDPSENCLSSVFILLKVKVKVDRALFSSYVLKLKKKHQLDLLLTFDPVGQNNLEHGRVVSSPDKFKARSLWKLDLFPNAGVHQEGQVKPHRDAVGHGRSQTGRVGGSFLETKKSL